jgi:hypothetical protein
VRIVPLLLVVAAVSACGGRKATHYNQGAVLDCLQRMNSTLLVRNVDGIALAFMSADGVSAVEPVYALFGSDRPANQVTRTLGLGTHDPLWTLDRGDVRIEGFGPYEPPIAKGQGISEAVATASAAKLDADVHKELEKCLGDNER